MKKQLFILLLSVIIINFFSFSWAGNIFVEEPVSAQSITNAISSATAGDIIIIPDGTYSNIGIIKYSVSGNANNPITLKAENPGGVIFEGRMKIEFTGSYLIVKDFWFSKTKEINAIQFKGSSFNRVTNCAFTECAYQTIMAEGAGSSASTNNRIDHNFFANNYSSIIFVSMNQYNNANWRIDHNLFKDAGGSGNNVEMIGLGSGLLDFEYETNHIVERNIFDNCAAPGEPEVISNKTSNNIIRYNVFKNSKGLNLRAGNNCIVEGNYLFGEPGKTSYGIGIAGSGHLIINNYLENIQTKTAIHISAGNETGTAPVSKNCIIAYNTAISSNTYSVFTGGDSIAAHNITIVNNLFIQSTGIMYRDYNVSYPPLQPAYGFVWLNNIFYAQKEAVVGINNQGVITDSDPKLIRGDFIWRVPPSGSPALGAGSVVAGVEEDIDGHQRSTTNPDIGCDEFSTQSPVRLPVTENDVGINWDNPISNPKRLRRKK